MTTAADVKRWTKVILAQHSDLVLEGRYLYLTPMQHIYRSIVFIGSSDGTFSRPTVMFGALFAPPSVPMGYSLGRELTVGHSTDPNFDVTLLDALREALSQHLRRLNTIQEFHDATLDNHMMAKATDEPRLRSPILQAAVLAALGRLKEACSIAEKYIEQIDEQSLLDRLAKGKTLQEKHRLSSDASFHINMDSHALRCLDDMKSLCTAARSGDRTAVGKLLRTWERERARALRIEHLWEATPFPVEGAA